MINGMALAEKHRVLRHFVVQDRGASNRVSHENKNVEHFYLIFVFVLALNHLTLQRVSPHLLSLIIRSAFLI